jgi:hypothetical protein
MNGSHHQRLLSITLRDLRAACCPQLAPAAARRAIAQCASTVSRVDSILSAVLENGMHRNYDSDYYCNTYERNILNMHRYNVRARTLVRCILCKVSIILASYELVVLIL